ncbi:MAG: alpha/beta hydrolase family protein, partial [Roseimicrobium sp.]
LYVTANLYRPKVVDKPLPTMLYVCGHSSKEKGGISYGNKAGYEHHGVWYAKHGFVCLIIDTVQLGEIRGEHHGTYSKGRWWWMARGYTPAGVEAWAGIRALDYLETRPEVDKTRFGISGRSGGGAYSWWIAALDERIKAAAPTAGITTLRNHVVDGCVEGHCDCMFMVNTYRWDYDKLAALVAPRPLCIVNTDKDRIFPVDGVFNIYQSTRRIYKLLDAEKNIGLQFAEGPHMDTQPLNVGEFHWMTRFLQGAELMSTLDSPAVKGIPMEKLRVFTELPKDQLNTKIDETFVAKAPEPKMPEYPNDWKPMREAWMKALKEKCFAGHSDPALPFVQIINSPEETSRRYAYGTGMQELLEVASPGKPSVSPAELVRSIARSHLQWKPPGEHAAPAEHMESRRSATRHAMKEHGRYLMAKADMQVADGVSMERFKMLTLDESPLDFYLLRRADLKPEELDLVVINVLDEKGWKDFANTFASTFPTQFPKDAAAQGDAKAFEQEKKMFQNFKWGMAYVCPRGIGPGAWDKPVKADDAKAKAAAEKASTQRLRRFYLLGQTLDGQQVWDIRCAIRALRAVDGMKDTKLWLQASRLQAGNTVYASLFEDGITRLDLHEVPHTHAEGPIYLNVLKYLDMPQAVAMASERTRVIVYDDDKEAWAYPQKVSDKLEWAKEKKAGFSRRDVPKAAAE